MLLSLRSLFRPRWQSQHASVRARAVSRLNPQSEAGQSALKQLAMGDNEADIRQQAMIKLNDPQLLKQLSQPHQPPAVQAQACKLLCELITSRKEKPLKRQQLLELMEGMVRVDLLTHIALNAPDQQIRRYAVYQIDDQQALEQVARYSDDLQQQKIAIQAIEDPQRLQRLLQRNQQDEQPHSQSKQSEINCATQHTTPSPKQQLHQLLQRRLTEKEQRNGANQYITAPL